MEVIVSVVVALQAALITALVMQGIRRRRSELALRETEGRFRRMADGAPVMIWTANPELGADFVNSRVLEFTGLSQEHLLGEGWLDRVHPDEIDRTLKTYVSAFEAREPFRMEYRLRRADGSYRWLLATGVPRFSPDGSFAGYIGSALDITERKEMEQALLENQDELSRAYQQNQDLAGRLIDAQETERRRIARDLHDDMSQQLAGLAIMLSALKRLISRGGSQLDVDRTLSTLQDRTAAIAEAIRNLSHELHPSVLDHAGLVATLKRHCVEVEGRHHLRVTFAAPDEMDSVSSDVALCLFRVAQEALTNAVRHARAQTIVVRLVPANDDIELSVIDDGVGFVPEELNGRGLGLRSIDERVRLSRGTMRVDSRPGHGTNLRVRVPLKSSEPDLAHES